MEKQISKIIETNRKEHGSTGSYEISAKEIKDHAWLFVGWMGKMGFYYKEDAHIWVCIFFHLHLRDMTFNTLDELYTYWKDNVYQK